MTSHLRKTSDASAQSKNLPRTMRINMQPYNPAWPCTFSHIQSSLESLLRVHSVPFLAVEHVGSTAVPGLAAKTIIDIDVIVNVSALWSAIAVLTTSTNTTSTPSAVSATFFPASSPSTPTSAAPATVAVGESYTYIGERGILARHALREPGVDGDGDEGGGDEARHTRNVYVCVEGCLALRNHLAVRDTLRRDEALRKEYEGVKWAAAEREWESVEGYVEAKTEVLVKVRRVGVLGRRRGGRLWELMLEAVRG